MALSRAADPSLCESCRTTDYEDLNNNAIKNVHEGNYVTRAFLINLTYTCALCKLWMSEYRVGETVELRGLDFSTHGSWTFPGASCATLLSIGRVGERHYRSDYTENIFYESFGDLDEGPKLLRPRPLGEIPLYGDARAWLHNCQAYHGKECNSGSASPIEDLLLIDCENMSIVRAATVDAVRWLALSYVWGDTDQTPEGCRRTLKNAPRTVKDAIIVTKELGYRYLWVDEFCINQQSSVHKLSQIMQMDRIYSGADLTIVAAAGNHKNYGLPGVTETPRNKYPAINVSQGLVFRHGPDPTIDVVQKAQWFARAWTFQEGVLSNRLLVFTDDRMAFYCQKTSWMEGLGGPQHAEQQHMNWDSWPVHCTMWHPTDLRFCGGTEEVEGNHWDIFGRLVSLYSGRLLSYPSDVLNGIAGVLRRLKQSNDAVLSLCGLPYYQHTQDESIRPVEHAVGMALSWFSRVPEVQPTRRKLFPTWTWAEWAGMICWSHGYTSYYRSRSSYLHELRMESSSGSVLEPSELWSWSELIDLQNTLDSVTALVFKAPILPIHEVFTITSHFTYSKHPFTDGGPDKDIVDLEGVRLDKSSLHTADDEELPDDDSHIDPLQSSNEEKHEHLRWSQVKVANASVSPWARPPTGVKHLVSNVKRGIWSCFLIMEEVGEDFQTTFVLVVEWDDESTARRVGGFHLISPPKAEDGCSSLWPSLKMRTVRLV